MLPLVSLPESIPPLGNVGRHQDGNAEGPGGQLVAIDLGFGDRATERVSDLVLLNLSNAVDEVLRLPDRNDSVEIANEDFESPVATLIIEAPHAAMAHANQLAYKFLESVACTRVPVGDAERPKVNARCRQEQVAFLWPRNQVAGNNAGWRRQVTGRT